ncbi:hypothetical protein HDK64DRAFT_86495 [Phyllosticta capitalensis]
MCWKRRRQFGLIRTLFLAHLPILSHLSRPFFCSSPRTANMNGSAKGHNRHVCDSVLLERQQTEQSSHEPCLFAAAGRSTLLAGYSVRSMYGCRALVWKKEAQPANGAGSFFSTTLSRFLPSSISDSSSSPTLDDLKDRLCARHCIETTFCHCR